MKLRFALAGCGRIGARHAELIIQHGQLVAVCDIDTEKASTFGEKYNAKVYSDWQMLLKSEPNIDVAVICTPNGLHGLHSICALEKKMHVLCEKPMAISSKEAHAMVIAAKSSGRHLVIVKQNRFNPPVLAVKKMLDEGRLGRIFSVQVNCFWNRDAAYYANSWKGSKELDGGTLYTQFSHFIDLMIWLVGKASPVFSVSKNYLHQHIIEFEDTGVVSLVFESGAIGSLQYTVNASQQNMEGSITLFGEKGTVKIGGQYLNELEYQRVKDMVIGLLPQGNPANHYGTYTGSMSNHHLVYKNFIQLLKGEASMINNLDDAVATVALIEKIYEMAEPMAGESEQKQVDCKGDYKL